MPLSSGPLSGARRLRSGQGLDSDQLERLRAEGATFTESEVLVLAGLESGAPVLKNVI